MNIHFESILSPRACWTLERLYEIDRPTCAAVVSCISRLEQDPYPPESERTTLIVPREPPYREAYRCGGWGIAFHVENHAFIYVEVIARLWPPSLPNIRDEPKSP